MPSRLLSSIGFLLFFICSNSLAYTAISYIDGDTYNTGDPNRNTLRFDQYNTWAYGDNYLFFETSNAFENGTTIYGEWSPRLSLGKVFNKNLQTGIIKDYMLAGTLEMSGSGHRAYLLGLGLPLALPHFKSAGINIYNRNNPTLHGSTYQITLYWNLPFTIKRFKFVLFGHADIAGRETSAYQSNQLIQPYLLLDIGNFWHKPGSIYAGMRYNYWHHVQGTSDSEHTPEFVVRWIAV